ncbi:MAG: hypothetical protein QOH41_1247 [Blastocatellia bacterium]|jgi:hypothetical protein|nr:hypothetical protein [Blastocatellia bacterium]
MTWLIDQLAKEWAVIKQAPLSFVIISTLAVVLAFTLVKYIFQERLRHKDDLINSLERKLALSGSASTGEVETSGSQTTDLLAPELELLHEYFVDVGKTEWGVYFQVGSDFTGRVFKAALLDFNFRAIPGSVPWVEVRAQIIFNDVNNQRMHLIDGIWHGRDSVEVPFRPGEKRSLVIATCTPGSHFGTYEHRMRDPGRPVVKPFLCPLERKIDEDSVHVQVRLTGKYMDNPRFNEFWCFKLSRVGQLAIQKITPEEFEKGLS